MTIQFKVQKLIKLMFLTFMTVFLLAINSYDVKAAWDAHLSESGDVEIYTVDKKKTSRIWYKTVGIDVTRCVYPAQKEIHPSGEYVELNMGNPVSDVGTAIVSNTFTIPMEELISKAGGEWAEEIRKAIDGTGPAVYIKLDCQMYTVDETKNPADIRGPYRNIPPITGGKASSGMLNGVMIEDAYGWANKAGLRTHYNHYLLIGQGADIPDVSYDDELVCFDHTADNYKGGKKEASGPDEVHPTFATGNWSDIYDIAKGIPTTETIKNRMLADEWYGYTWVWARCVQKKYEHKIDYWWEEGEYDDAAEDGGISIVHEIVDLPIGYATVCYQYLDRPHFYDFTHFDVWNDAYAGDHIVYEDGINHEVDMQCISTHDYVDVTTPPETKWAEMDPDIDWSGNNEKHLEGGKFPPKPSYRQSRKLGSRAELEAAIIEDTKALQKLISDRVKTRNDYLYIGDGHYVYMNNDWVTGCDFFDYAGKIPYRECKKSSAYVKDYLPGHDVGAKPLFDTDPRDVEMEGSSDIPYDVANGLYFTETTVYYQRLITRTKGVETHRSDNFGVNRWH